MVMVKKAKKKVRQSVWVGIDLDLANELKQAEGRFQRAQATVAVRGGEVLDADRRLLAETEAEFERLREQIREEATEFIFESIGRKKFEKLLKEHPPTDEQVAEAKAENIDISHNPDTFPYALIDASCVQPEFEPGELYHWLFEDEDDEWNQGEIAELYNAAMAVNMTAPRANLGKESRRIPSSEQNWHSATNGESDTANGEAGQ